MGGGSYSVSNSILSRDAVNSHTGNTYRNAPTKELFKETKIHQNLDPRGVAFRECRDNADHPNAIPLQVYLDVTGSMGHIPVNFIRDGLPTMMGTLLQAGVPDTALMFGAIGDHEYDRAPLQVGQFEADDELLDVHLKNTYLEGGGGGNRGESYALAWAFAGRHVKTDAWEKRKQKGFVFTIGDEAFLNHYPKEAFDKIQGEVSVAQGVSSAAQLLELAEETNHVFHIHVDHGRPVDSAWRELLGDNLLIVVDYLKIPELIAEKILEFSADFGKKIVESDPIIKAEGAITVGDLPSSETTIKL